MADLTHARVVSGGAAYRATQGPDYVPGVSADTAGSTVLWLGKVTIEPGGRTRAHVHARHESAFHMLSGDSVEIWSGPGLEQHETVRPGDYIFIPANVLHVAVNRSTEPAVFIGTRNEPTAQESVELHPEMDARVP
jgi:uncharacterized RmlC-like cupin family protein